jgi:hypothetical protein
MGDFYRNELSRRKILLIFFSPAGAFDENGTRTASSASARMIS